jgi:hypothetical protein
MPRWLSVRLAVVRPVLTAGVLIVGYSLLPGDRRLSGRTLVLLIAELVLVAGVIAWQVRLTADLTRHGRGRAGRRGIPSAR